MICSSCFCGTPLLFFSSPGFNVSTIPDISSMPGSFYLFQFCERSEHSLDSEPVKVHGDLIVSAAFRNALYHSHSEFHMADGVSHSIVQRIRLGDRKLPGLKSFRGIFFSGHFRSSKQFRFFKGMLRCPVPAQVDEFPGNLPDKAGGLAVLSLSPDHPLPGRCESQFSSLPG